MRVLITGARGMMGSALVREYASDPVYSVYPLSRAEVDLRDFRATIAKFNEIGPEIVVHAAALVGGIKANADAPAAYFYENLLINSNVVEAARQAEVRKFIALGSVAVYSDLAVRPIREEDIWLGAPHPSEAAYGHAKRTMLAHLEANQLQYGLDFLYGIVTNAFGFNDRFDETRGHVVPALMSKFLSAIASSGPVEVWGTGAARRDFIFASDAARAIRLAGERTSGAINIASGRTTSIADLVTMLREVSGFAGEIVWDRAKPEGQVARQYDVGRLCGLGFMPEWELKPALAETFRWLQAHSADARR